MGKPEAPQEGERMSITGNEPLAGVYNTHIEAEAEVRELQKAGFDMKKLSMVGKD
jgi:hypothetical protein